MRELAVLAVALSMACVCNVPASFATAPATEMHPVAAAAEYLNSARFEIDVDHVRTVVKVYYPCSRVFIAGSSATGTDTRDIFDSVYATFAPDPESGQLESGLVGRVQEALPGHPVTSATWLGAVLHIRTQDEYAYDVSAAEGRAATIDAMVAFLKNQQPLAEAYYPAIGMQQLVHGEWVTSRRYCMNSFAYFVAPMEDVRVELLAQPLHVLYYADRVELTASGASEPIDTRLTVGFDGIPDALAGVDSLVLHAGEPHRLSFTYSGFLSGTADINATAVANQSTGALPFARLSSRLALFPTTDQITFAPVDSELFTGTFARRSTILDRLLRIGPKSYFPNDERVPDWAVEDFYRRYPFRRPR